MLLGKYKQIQTKTSEKNRPLEVRFIFFFKAIYKQLKVPRASGKAAAYESKKEKPSSTQTWITGKKHRDEALDEKVQMGSHPTKVLKTPGIKACTSTIKSPTWPESTK